MIKNRSEIAQMFIGCLFFLPFLNCIPQKRSVHSALVRCYTSATLFKLDVEIAGRPK
jgi:hypothetical protein